MCGIVGALMFGNLKKKEEVARQESVIFLVSELMRLTEKRGTDATGVATLFKDGNYMIQKAGIKSSEFLKTYGGTKNDYEGYLKIWRENTSSAKMFMSHCRKSSVGNSFNNQNNHPIRVQDTIAIHNGTLTNHHKIIANLGGKKDAEVDSEAIVRLLNKFSNNGRLPFTLDSIEDVVNRLQGSYAVLAFNGNNPYQFLAFRDGRPIEFVFIKKLQTVIIASELTFLKTVFELYNTVKRLYANNNFISLASTDLEYKILLDDSIAIFDLSRKITEDSVITDLYDTKKTSRTNKVWLINNNNTNELNYNLHDYPPNKTNAYSTYNSNSGRHANSGGMIWNKSLQKHVPKINNRLNDAIGNMELNMNTFTITKLCDTFKNKSQGTNSSMAPLQVANQASNDVKLLAADTTRCNAELDTSSEKLIAVDVVIDTEAVECALSALSNTHKFETEEDVLEEIEVEDLETIKAFPLNGLANRIKSYVFKAAYYLGYVDGKKVAISTAEDAVKLENSRSAIKILKHVVGIFSQVTDSLAADQTPADTARDKKIRAIEKIVKHSNNKPCNNMSALNNIFSSGDLRDNNLNQIVYEIENSGDTK